LILINRQIPLFFLPAEWTPMDRPYHVTFTWPADSAVVF
jgi:hypothetical protein